MNPAKVLRYLPSSGKIIVVIRDPRDVYAEGQISHETWTFQPEDIDEFMRYQTAMFTRWEREKKKSSAQRVMQLKFEDLVLNYDETVPAILEFLNIDPALHKNVKKYLDPDVSKKNADLWKKVLTDKEKEKMATVLKDLLKGYGWL